jgi:hypothetical protein
VRQRGPVKAADGIVDPVATSARALGIIGSFRPDNVFKVGVIRGNNTDSVIQFLSDNLSATAGTYTLPHVFPDSGPYPIVDAKPALGGQFLLGISDRCGNGAAKRSIMLWRGAGKSDYSTGTFSATAGNATITGSGTSWTANVEPGMFFFGNAGSGNFFLHGVVKTVNSDTSITLEQGALATASAGSSYKVTSVRGLSPRYARGRITGASGQAVLNGGDTKWKDSGIDNTWSLYRAQDMALMGTVSSVASNTQLTLSGNIPSGLGVTNERYVLIKSSNVTYAPAVVSMGFLHAVWNGYQFYANQDSFAQTVNQVSRVFFSEQVDIEAIDFSKDDGSFFDVPSSKSSATELMALIPTNNALLMFKEDEVYGLFGTTPDTWHPRRVEDDGCLSNHTVWTHEGSAIWAGKKGIYVYDGVEARNVTDDTLGTFYADMIRTMNHEVSRAWAMVSNNHYILYLESVTPTRGVTKTNSTEIPTKMTIILNLDTMAATFHTNLDFHGAIVTPGEVGKGTIYVGEKDAATRDVFVGKADDVFKSTGLDSVIGWGNEPGPQVYFEWLKYSAGEAQRKKLFKQVQIHHKIPDGIIRLDVIPDLNETATVSQSFFGPTTSWINKRIKFLKRSAFLSFRLWAPGVTDFGNVSDNGSGFGTDSPINNIVMHRVELESGTISSITAEFDTGVGGNCRAIVYNANGAGEATTKVAQTNVSAVPAGGGDVAFTFASPVAITTGTYWVGVWGDSNCPPVKRSNNPLITSPIQVLSQSFASSAPDPWPSDSTAHTANHLRLYLSINQRPTDVQFGPWGVGFKRQRVGRV